MTVGNFSKYLCIVGMTRSYFKESPTLYSKKKNLKILLLVDKKFYNVCIFDRIIMHNKRSVNVTKLICVFNVKSCAELTLSSTSSTSVAEEQMTKYFER